MAASGRWFEQLEPGLRVEHATTRTVTETDNVLFTTMTMNPQPLHLDAEFTARAPNSGGRWSTASSRWDWSSGWPCPS